MAKIVMNNRGMTQCPCCQLFQNEFMFPFTDKTKTARSYAKCIGCKRENCYSSNSCKLGTLHDH